MIAVIDYKAGNLTSVLKSLDATGALDEPGGRIVTEDPDVVRRADKIVLPGVGHFKATQHLRERGLEESVRERTAAGVPFLGICVGLQWLFAGSTEAPDVAGLGAFEGECSRFDAPDLKCPHVGWNALAIARPSLLTAGMRDGEHVYFTHSFRAPVVGHTTAICNYGGGFSAIVERDNIMGAQFHPEKSGAAGLLLLRNFLRL
ncbi:imidazole glycerol phosphate synthase subunit HisH [Acidipila sp. EB88]|uniref:imidazole glycerol phosphate synthase subunit HisH n=1 Tax=Acidipila sp. EB88 TaxID=2305226 RepID=UPI000F5EF90B|nr:imidazole glycerol phosphate synthase subunit HisH [Acidipila sp. EB88]RRA47852.1 imidazole glycerol phosphate synthase subunit HisH [Acidipila sp. EB88]